jgi:hypothetical protein
VTATHPLDPAIAAVSEFPERLGPVLIKELRQGLRSGLFVLPFVILPAVLGLVAVWALAIEDIGNARNGVSVCFWLAVVVPVLFITPLRALATIRSEREAQTLDLLQLTPLTAWRIVLAKWSSLQAQAVLWVTGLLPFLVLRYFFGGMNLTEELGQLFWIVVTGGVLTAFGLVISTMPRLVFWLSLAGIVFVGIIGLWSLVIMIVGPAGFGRASFFRSSGVSSWLAQLTSLLMAAHLTYLALAYAGSRIAPLADNYALRLRGGTLALFGWYGLASLLLTGPAREVRGMFFVVAAVATVLFTTLDLTMSRAPLQTHVRPFARFGSLGTALGRAFMPGWPGALVFFSAVTVLATMIGLFETNDRAEVVAFALILWPAVVLPRALQCFFSPDSQDRPALHLVLHLAGLLLAVTLSAFGFVLGGGIFIPATIFPSALPWLVPFEAIKLDTHLVTVAVAGALWVIGLAAVFLYHSRSYWAVMNRHVHALRSLQRTRANAPSAAPPSP